GDILFKDRILRAPAIIWIGDEFRADLTQRAVRVGRVMTHQLAHHHLPWLQLRLVPLRVPLARFGLEERILDTAPGPPVRMAHPCILRPTRRGGTGVAMADPVAFYPDATDMVRLARVQLQRSGVD